MELEPEALIALRRRVKALRATPCGMAHESIPAGPDGKPVQSARSPSGFARAGICPDAVRAANLSCSHTMARHALRDALMQVPGAGADAVLAALHDLEQEISLLDHRRYDAESRRASARLADADGAAGEREIASLVAEHRACVTRAAGLRDEVLCRIDDALAAGGARGGIGVSLRGRGKQPVAPVFIDGKKAVTLRGPTVAADFKKMVID